MNKILTREQLFNVADEFRVSRYDTGLIDKITAYKKGNLIHTSQAIYTTVNGLTRLTDIQGFLFPEIWNSLETPQLEWYDRNPLDVNLDYDQILAPHITTVRWTYTVPTKRKTYIELLTLFLQRETVTTGAHLNEAEILFTPLNGTATFLPKAYLITNTVGDYRQIEIGQSILALAGDQIQFATQGTDDDGLVRFAGCMKATEFDA